MMIGGRIETRRAVRALEKAGGPALADALRKGYAAAGRIVRDHAKATTKFKDRTGAARKSWKVQQMKKPYNQARLINTAFYTRWLEKNPHNYEFLTDAAKTTGSEQLNAAAKAVRAFLKKLRGPK